MKVSRNVSSNNTKKSGLVAGARRALASLLWNTPDESPIRGRLLLEQLESRQLMAGDADMLFTDGVVTTAASQASSAVFASTSSAEGEAAQDLVAFAKALRDGGVKFYGAAWCPICTQQKQLFEDGGKFLPFIEVTKADRSLNSVGTAAGVPTFPTWDIPKASAPNGFMRLTGPQTLATLSQESGIAIPTSDTPSLASLGSQTVGIGSPLHIPIDAYDPGGGPITISVTVADPTLIQASVLSGNRSIRIDMEGYGDMVFQLFEDRAPRPASRVIELANSNFYDNILFHRVIDNFVIQAGDPLGNGTGGSNLADFDDQFHPDLQHNRTGILSYAKSSDDTNDSQFFITEGPTRTLDFNHSIFGQLVEGEDVREAISKLGNSLDKGTNGSDKPLIDVRMTSMDVFSDNENGVIMLKAIGNRTGTTNVTVTVRDANGNTTSEVVPVTVVADSGQGSNSQPFLNNITTPSPAPNTAPVQLQLSSVDVEGDAVTYTGSSATTGVTAAVNANTGLVTVTPSAGFVGNAIVNVTVAPASGVVGALSGQNDNQRVTFNFTGTGTVAAPTSVDLVTASDSGTSSTDNRTNVGSLVFTVAGVQAGNEVRLFSGTTEVGRGTATGNTINITTNNIAALGDGTYSITARQFSGSTSSDASPALSITYDATQPIRQTGFPTSANVGVALNTNLTHPEEGNGLAYSFGAAPTGATINASTGVISWTPTSTQTGSQSFTLNLTDQAGNVRTEVFVVTVAGTPQAEVRLEVANLAGTAITNVAVGDEFLLRFYARDVRGSFDRKGVFSAFTDILFDSALVTPVTTTPIQFGPTFSTNSSGSFSTGLIDELGALTNNLSATNLQEVLVATVRMRATTAGSLSFISESADIDGNEFLLFEQDDPVANSLIQFGRADLSIGARFTAVNDTLTVAQGATATTINVLQNDTFNSGVTGTLTVASVGTPSNGGTVSVVTGGVSYRPAATFAGTETFTYVARDNTGATQMATVTVSVTGTNNPPPTAVSDSFPVVEDALEATFNVRANDTTADAGETISVTAVGTSSRGSTVRLGADGSSIVYRPAANFVGSETITYTLADSRGANATGTATFTVTAVNDAPPANNITKTVFKSTTAVPVASLADYGTNVDGSTETLTVSLVVTATGGGTFAVSGTNITYTPPSASFTGTVTTSYRTTDAGGLSTTGTITLNVIDAVPTTYSLTLNDRGGMASLGSGLTATLTGTTATGATVNRSVALSTTATPSFADLAPGNYQVEIPAVPFLVGMEQPQRLTFTATSTGGAMTGTANVGFLHPRFISIRDFFSNAPRQAIFAAVAPGTDSVVVLGSQSTTSVVAPIVNLNQDASSVTIRGNTTAGAATQATVPAANDRRVETRAAEGGLRLLKISLATGDVTFSAPSTTTTTQSLASSSVPAGENASARPAAVVPATANASLFAAPLSAEGESEDESDDESDDGSLSRMASSPFAVVDEGDENESVVDAIDEAFADVTDGVKLVSKTADSLAEGESSAPDASVVDQILTASQ